MNKLMIPPILVGFICLFASLISGLGPVTQYTTNSQGEVITNHSNISFIANNSLHIEYNGICGGVTNWAYDTSLGTAWNNQTGNRGWEVFGDLGSQTNQYCQWSIANSSQIVGATYNPQYNPYQISFFGSSTQSILISTIIANINNNISINKLDQGLPYGAGNSSGSYSWTMVITNVPGHNLSYELNQKFGFYVWISLIYYPNGGSSGDILGENGFVIIFMSAAIVGGIAAITIFGSKIDFFGQKLIFASATFIVLWALLSVAMYPYVISIPNIGAIIWLFLSGMYFLGLISQLLNGENSGG